MPWWIPKRTIQNIRSSSVWYTQPQKNDAFNFDHNFYRIFDVRYDLKINPQYKV